MQVRAHTRPHPLLDKRFPILLSIRSTTSIGAGRRSEKIRQTDKLNEDRLPRRRFTSDWEGVKYWETVRFEYVELECTLFSVI